MFQMVFSGGLQAKEFSLKLKDTTRARSYPRATLLTR
ncbi:hypothetical protein M5D96_002032 [Drosophila gunungcola]|uniref:Uncharacterized protein n=1 Tax=Drosophila gunungcola TaxID=103775 RepID=A0A9P9YZ63_9MUSC|nr:hypothetical protein M5D96_002032 [Drosophila gunungcola]